MAEDLPQPEKETPAAYRVEGHGLEGSGEEAGEGGERRRGKVCHLITESFD